MSDLLNLADRVEASTGADRELNAAIWVAYVPGATRTMVRYFHKATGKECVIDETRDASGRLIIVPDYLGSLDAAMTLAPEGMEWQVSRFSGDDGGAAQAEVWVDDAHATAGRCRTPARALTAASLRAIHARGCADGEEGNA